MIALIDADIILYRVGFSSEDTEQVYALIRADDLVKDILEATKADEYQLWFSDRLENNFRFKIDPNYKKSRQTQPKPKHYDAIKKFLTYEWGAKVSEGQEADDELGIQQTLHTRVHLQQPTDHSEGEWKATSGIGRNRSDRGKGVQPVYTQTVICTIDKDLDQVPGLHYNFVRRESYYVQPGIGLKSFYSQFLIGDRVDDIEGIRGFGPVYTRRLIDPCQTEMEMFEKVREKYNDDQRLLKNGKLLWVRREPNQEWEFPVDEPRVDEVLPDEGGLEGDITD